mgnify:CR=1 FL=1
MTTVLVLDRSGSMMAPDELAAVVRWCAAKGVRLISDEIYHGITYGRPVATALVKTPPVSRPSRTNT